MEWLIIYVIFSGAAAVLAEKCNRNPGAYLALALLASPLIAFVFLVVLGPAPEPHTSDPRWKNLNDGVRRPSPASVAAGATALAPPLAPLAPGVTVTRYYLR